MTPHTIIDCGWGRLLMGQTFASQRDLVEALIAETPQQRDVALYAHDPHVLVALAPQQLFLDPSHTFRLTLSDAAAWPAHRPGPGWQVRAARPDDEGAINRILTARQMVPVREGFLAQAVTQPALLILVAEETDSGNVLGVVTGVDHVAACDDPDGGSSLWSLAVDPQCVHPGIGPALVSDLVSRFVQRGLHHLDLSVMHDNAQAIELYEKMGFQRVPIFCVKNRNPINELLYVGADSD